MYVYHLGDGLESHYVAHRYAVKRARKAAEAEAEKAAKEADPEEFAIADTPEEGGPEVIIIPKDEELEKTDEVTTEEPSPGQTS